MAMGCNEAKVIYLDGLKILRTDLLAYVYVPSAPGIENSFYLKFFMQDEDVKY